MPFMPFVNSVLFVSSVNFVPSVLFVPSVNFVPFLLPSFYQKASQIPRDH